MAYNNKNPPKFDETISYENWKNDIAIWQELTDLDKSKQALAIHLSLSGKARQASSELGVDVLKNETGVKTLLNKLDEVYLVEKSRRQFSAFQELYKFKRDSEQSIGDFVNEFDRKYFRFTQEDMKLPDAVMAFMLLVSCNLPDTEFQLVMTATGDISFKNIKASLKRIFGNGVSSDCSTPVKVKVEPVFQTEAFQGGAYGYSARGGEYARQVAARGGRYNRGGHRGVYSRQTFSRGVASNYGDGVSPSRGKFNWNRGGARANRGRGRKINPLDASGQASRCLICDSRYHWARECPRAYENCEDETYQTENYVTDVENEVVQLTLLNDATVDSGDYKKKLSVLVGESLGSIVLDTGCSTTVCGEDWLAHYMDTLSDKEWASIKEEPTRTTFKFGDGKNFHSVQRLVLPCKIAGIKATIRTDVVECNIPLLLSRDAMKRAKMQINFENDTVVLAGKTVNLICTSTGHYCLPLAQ